MDGVITALCRMMSRAPTSLGRGEGMALFLHRQALKICPKDRLELWPIPLRLQEVTALHRLDLPTIRNRMTERRRYDHHASRHSSYLVIPNRILPASDREQNRPRLRYGRDRTRPPHVGPSRSDTSGPARLWRRCKTGARNGRCRENGGRSCRRWREGCAWNVRGRGWNARGTFAARCTPPRRRPRRRRWHRDARTKTRSSRQPRPRRKWWTMSRRYFSAQMPILTTVHLSMANIRTRRRVQHQKCHLTRCFKSIAVLSSPTTNHSRKGAMAVQKFPNRA